MKIKEFIEKLKIDSEERFVNFNIEPISTIKHITEEAYLEKPTWVGGDTEFVCLYVDLNKSSKISFKKQPQTMAKIYDYFTQNLVDVFNKFEAEYIDIKGDGAFAIFEGEKASYRAFYAAITFKELFDSKIKNKFTDSEENSLKCKIGIHKDKILVKKIGKRGDYNEVWAGRLVNNAANLASEYKNIDTQTTPIIVSEKIYLDFIESPEYGLYRCHNGDENIIGEKENLFKEVSDFSDETLGDKYYYTEVAWCNYCADDYINKI